VRGTIALDGAVVRRPNPLRLSRLGVELVAERDKVFANMSVFDQMRLVMSGRPDVDGSSASFRGCASAVTSEPGC
jgi:branched-chain amino acid transport system ATP-binding protein